MCERRMWHRSLRCMGMLLLLALILAVFFLPSPWGVVAVVVAALIELLEAGAFMWWSKRRQVAVGAETLVGRRAVVVRTVAPTGQVKLDGELWEARSDHVHVAGSSVVVTALDGLTLVVTTEGDAAGRR